MKFLEQSKLQAAAHGLVQARARLLVLAVVPHRQVVPGLRLRADELVHGVDHRELLGPREAQRAGLSDQKNSTST